MVVLSGTNENRTTIEELSNSNICYSIEIINSIIPPWVISGICAAMTADGTSFDSMYGQLSLSLSTFRLFNFLQVLLMHVYYLPFFFCIFLFCLLFILIKLMFDPITPNKTSTQTVGGAD